MTTIVNEYITQFTTLIDQLNAYAKHPDPIYYVQHFIEGLRDDIKIVVLLQRPTTLDTACVLARL
jgi:glutathione synthase/RimK-type ligase-like ATP-grasp enzyme